MSTVCVQVAKIGRVRAHPNAERLDVAEVLGWQVVVARGQFTEGQWVVYVPPDTVLPAPLLESLGIAQYCPGGRIRAVKLRGEPSFGLCMGIPDGVQWEIGRNVSDYYGAIKYEPPLRVCATDQEADHPLFPGYTDIQNLRNYPTLFSPGEDVMATEKVHGTNCRFGLIEGVWMAGSANTRKKEPATDAEKAAHLYWLPYTISGVRPMLSALCAGHKSAIVYGETYGCKVQSLQYDCAKNRGFLAFDLMVDGQYMDADEFKRTCLAFGVATTPIIYRGPYSFEKITDVCEGRTTIGGGDHIREGVVVRPARERTDPRVGRVVLKCVSFAYLGSKHVDSKWRDY